MSSLTIFQKGQKQFFFTFPLPFIRQRSRSLFIVVLVLLLNMNMPASDSAYAGNATTDEPRQYLQLKDKKDTVLFSLAIQNGFTFGIRFIHSVAKSPVEEWFNIENGIIFLEKTVYQDFGAGLPYRPEPGQTMTCKDGHIIISGYHRALPMFDVRVGRIAQHTLILPEANGQWKEIPLSHFAPPGEAITFILSNQS